MLSRQRHLGPEIVLLKLVYQKVCLNNIPDRRVIGQVLILNLPLNLTTADTVAKIKGLLPDKLILLNIIGHRVYHILGIVGLVAGIIRERLYIVIHIEFLTIDLKHRLVQRLVLRLIPLIENANGNQHQGNADNGNAGNKDDSLPPPLFFKMGKLAFGGFILRYYLLFPFRHICPAFILVTPEHYFITQTDILFKFAGKFLRSVLRKRLL